MTDTWLIMHLPTQVYVWNLGEIADEGRDGAIMAARTFAGFPANDTWPYLSDVVEEFVADGVPPRQVKTTNLSITFGNPHEKLMAHATTGPDLTKVSAKAVADYRAQYAANARQAQVDAARAALAQLHPDDLTALLRGN